MILDWSELMNEIYEEYPTIEKSALDAICKKGLVGVKKVLTGRDELIMRLNRNTTIKFFIPMTPADQRERTLYRAAVKKYRENEKADSKQVQ